MNRNRVGIVIDILESCKKNVLLNHLYRYANITTRENYLLDSLVTRGYISVNYDNDKDFNRKKPHKHFLLTEKGKRLLITYRSVEKEIKELEGEKI